MIEQDGYIVRVRGPWAWTSCRPLECRACAEGRGCGSGLFGRLVSRKPREICVHNPQSLPPNSSVVIGLEERQFMKGALLLYGSLLSGLMLGSLLGALVNAVYPVGEDFMVLLGAGSGCLLAIWAVRRCSTLPVPVIVRPAAGR